MTQDQFDNELSILLGKDSRPLLLAVSGGIDSMCLADLVAKSTLNVPFAIAHMNFSLRGDESDGDEYLVRQYAEHNGIDLYCKRVDTTTFAKSKSLSIEMAARELRYAWFNELAEDKGFGFIAVAHNANDNAETMFLNLLRGTGIKGICGIKAKNGKIIRPMLKFQRKEITEYASMHDVHFRVDSSNSDISYNRNHIRLNIIPEMERINPSLIATTSNEARHFSEIDEILNDLFEERALSFRTMEGNSTKIDTTAFLRDKHYGYWLFKMLNPLGFNEDQISLIGRLLTRNDRGGKYLKSDSHKAVFGRDVLTIYPLNDEKPQLSFSIKVYPKHDCFSPKRGLFLDAEKLGLKEGFYPLSSDGNIYCRKWLPADRFTPFGMKGSKKISDFLTERGLDIEQKRYEQVIVLRGEASGESILYACGRTSNRFRITTETRLIAEISIG